jgi:hypothetical protein
MFEDLYHRRDHLERHRAGPYAEERTQYLAFRASTGIPPRALWRIAEVILWVARLGHVSIDTTNVYAQIDLEMKTKALRHCEIFEKTPRKCWKGKNRVLQFLRSL